MPIIHRNITLVVILVGFLSISLSAIAQKKEKPYGLDVDLWTIKLSEGSTNEVNSLGRLTTLLVEVDSTRALGFLDSMETSPLAKGYYFRTYFSMVKADFLFAKFGSYKKYKDRTAKELQPIKEQLIKLQNDALDGAYHLENDLMIGWVSFYSAGRMRYFGETSWAVMYSKNGVDLFEKVGYDVEPQVYSSLADLLYQVREYDESILYAKKGMVAWKKREKDKDYQNASGDWVRTLTIIGNGFYRKKQLDSASVYYQQALAIAKQKNDTLLIGKVMGKAARILYEEDHFDSAYKLFKADYQNNKDDSIYNEAASASQWMAKTNLALGNNIVALAEAREAIRLLKLWPNGPHLRDTYSSLSQIFRATGNYDSAFYYNDLYAALNDSLEKEVVTSSLAISKAKLENEANRFNIQKLNREKKTELLWRNIIIGSILLLGLIGILAVNRQRLKEKIRKEKIEQEKTMMEQEVASARDQLKMFTENIVEKTTLIEKLESQVKGKEATEEQQSIISELSQQTILTEDDWTRFKLLFEKIYPGFFIKLKEKFPDITVAEQRMAALTRLRLTTRQIASMSGISVDSVHKSRQRLRQRFQIGADSNLDELVAAL